MLVVDDEEAIRDSIAYSFRAEGFEVVCREDGRSGLEAARRFDFDLLVLDLMLPDISGVDVARRIRSEADLPILMLTARDGEADLVAGFDAGADDYVAKPFSMRELISRAQAILRRREIDRTPRQTRRVGNLELDLLQHEVRVEGRRVRLTPTEFRILEILASEDRAWQRHELLAAAWGTSVVPDDRSCNVHVAHLRQKIEDDPTSPARIVTVRGVGYRLTR